MRAWPHTIFPLAAQFTKDYCGLSESCEEIMAEWLELAKDTYSHVPLKPGVRAYLKQCRAEGRRMAVVTSACRSTAGHLWNGWTLPSTLSGSLLPRNWGWRKRHRRSGWKRPGWPGVAPERCTIFVDSIAACRGAPGGPYAGGGRVRCVFCP